MHHLRGRDAANAQPAITVKQWDAVGFVKLYVSNPDLPIRLRLGKSLQVYDRSRFYGSWGGIREQGYIDYPMWEEQEANEQKATAAADF
jgi:2,4-dienoyl-CoA reductase-like NADH-dependent reductase (Old Yellow Enzyme family)